MIRERRTKKRHWPLALALSALGFYTLVHVLYHRDRSADAEFAIAPEIPLYEHEHYQVTKDTLQKGTSLYLSLRANGVDGTQIKELTQTLGEIFNVTKVHPGDHYTMMCDSGGVIQRFEYVPSIEHTFIVERKNEILQARKEVTRLTRIVRGVHGTLSDCFYNAIMDLGEKPQSMWAFVDILGWDIDFNIDPREGDEFTLLFEEYQQDGVPVKYGRILAAEYLAQKDTVIAIFYESPTGHSDHYDSSGRSLRKTFLKAPLRFKRVSSYYSHRRYHPILKIHCPHRGVDYAAPIGTPVQATADGVVVYAGWKGAYGRLVEIKHKNGYSTRYGHLSRYAKGIKKGKQVQQKELIGYVGSSGRSTGPHLHFELRRNGIPINPLKVNFPAAEPVPKSCKADFERIRDERLEALRRLRHTVPRVASAVPFQR